MMSNVSFASTAISFPCAAARMIQALAQLPGDLRHAMTAGLKNGNLFSLDER